MRYGRGGGQETKNAICILSLNMINDKVSAHHLIKDIITSIVGVCHPLGLALHSYFCRDKQVQPSCIVKSFIFITLL